MEANETTVGAATAGAAFGALIGWGTAALTGVDTGPIAAPLAVVGSFAFGRIFPR